MKTLLRFLLGTSIAFEAIVTICIFFDVVPGMLRDRLSYWALPFGVLTVGTVITYVVVGRTWDRMLLPEKLLAAIPAVAPLAAFRFMFVAVAFLVVAVLILAVVALVLSAGGGIGNILTAGSSRPTSNQTTLSFGSWWGDDRVRLGGDGRPAWIGDARVEYGTDGKPVLIGSSRVKYGSDGRIAWVGDDRVRYSNDGSVSWVGDRKVQP